MGRCSTGLRHGIFGFLARAVLGVRFLLCFQKLQDIDYGSFRATYFFLSVTNQGNEEDSSAGFVNAVLSLHKATLFAAENVHPNHPSSDWPHFGSLYQLMKSSIKRRALPS
jgi:hypothetical protein